MYGYMAAEQMGVTFLFRSRFVVTVLLLHQHIIVLLTWSWRTVHRVYGEMIKSSESKVVVKMCSQCRCTAYGVSGILRGNSKGFIKKQIIGQLNQGFRERKTAALQLGFSYTARVKCSLRSTEPYKALLHTYRMCCQTS